MLKEFTNQVLATLQTMLPGCELTVQQVNKPGEQQLTGICIRSEKSNVCPILYLDQPYQLYQTGTPIEAICKQLQQVYEKNCLSTSFDTSILTDWNKVSDRVCARLINLKQNSEYLQDKVFTFVPTTDIAVMYYVDLDSVTEGATAPVSQKLFASWNIDTGTLYDTAMRNTERIHQPSVRPMSAVMTEMMDTEELPFEEDPHMYVITSSRMVNGAILALIPSVYEQLQAKLGDVFLLPSSVHEMLAVPQNFQSPADLLAMVTEINHVQVAEADRLADDVFTIQNGQLVSVFSEEERRAIRRNALNFLPFPDDEID